MSSSAQIFVLPAFGQGHLLPSLELCKHLAASHNFTITLLIFSNLTSSVPSSFRQYSNIQITEIPSPPPPPPGSQPRARMRDDQTHMALALDNILSTTPFQPICAVVDVLLVMSWTAKTFQKFNVPTIAFFTSGACSAAMEYATWKNWVQDTKPGEILLLPGLPGEMGLTFSELQRRPGRGFGPPRPGERPSWLDDVEGSVAVMINTCDDLERPYIDYVAKEIGKPVWGVGPLLPESYWNFSGSLLQDRDSRRSNRRSSVSEDELIKWLDSKPPGSVLYVSFGSELSPTLEEYPQLAKALEESTRPFIWVIQPGSGRPGPPRSHNGTEQDDDEGYFPHGLDKKVGERGMIIKGWAPQLMILSHPSTGGFLSHCGWNSTVEAMGRGVPFLAWPIRGDQYYDAKLVVSHHKVGYMVADDMSKMVTRDDVARGIERLMGDEAIRKRAAELRAKFEQGFPPSSVAALNAFRDFIQPRLEE